MADQAQATQSRPRIPRQSGFGTLALRNAQRGATCKQPEPDGVQGLHEQQVPGLVTAGLKLTPYYSLVLTSPLLVGQEHVADHDNGCVGDLAVEVPGLNAFLQLEILLGHFEKDLYIPAFAIDSNHFFIRQVDVRAQ